jgi:hypothetical protein
MTWVISIIIALIILMVVVLAMVIDDFAYFLYIVLLFGTAITLLTLLVHCVIFD